MPVYHLTLHAYGSWTEDHPDGYVQRDEGLKQPNPKLNEARRKLQKQEAARFDAAYHEMLYDEWMNVCERNEATLHGVAITPTHIHVVLSFQSPACACGAMTYCRKACPAYRHSADLATRFKKNAGMALRRATGEQGRKWFSRGWHLVPVRGHPHYHRLLHGYLPQHRGEAGTVWINNKRHP